MQWRRKCAITWGRRRHTRPWMGSSRSSSIALLWMKMSFSIGVCCQQMRVKRMPRPYWIELWTTIRGFAYVSSWIELYKQTFKKTIQRSKALCKNLQDSSSATDWPLLLYLHVPPLYLISTCRNRSNIVQYIFSEAEVGSLSPCLGARYFFSLDSCPWHCQGRQSQSLEAFECSCRTRSQ